MSKYRLFLLGVVILAILASAVVIKMQMRLGLDIEGGTRVLFEVDPQRPEDWPTDAQEQQNKLNSIRDTINKRVKTSAELAESTVVPQSGNRIRVEIPGVKDPKKAIEYIGAAASLEFYHLKNVQTANNPLAAWKMSKGGDLDSSYVFSGDMGQSIDSIKDPKGVLEKVVDVQNNKPIVTGKDLLPNAKANLDPQEGNVIEIQFNKEGSDKFAEFTKKNVDEYLAVFFDGKLLTAPTIKTAITGGQAQISGFKSLEEAKKAADILTSGALPVPLKIMGQDVVEPTLGKDTVQKVLLAGIIGLVIVIFFMLVYYRLPGLLASISLCLYALFVIAAFILMKYPMSLSGIAALIISIGMAVDANILIFERLKEELKSGKTLRAAVDAGFSRAFSAILDSNVCTAITCAILMWYGGPAVYSFALTLIVGVAISMFTAITVTRTMMHLLVGWEKVQDPHLYGLTSGWMTKASPSWDIVGRRNYYFIFSGILIVPGLIFLAMFGLKPGIEFKAGTELQVQFESPVDRNALRSTVNGLAEGSEVQMASGGTMAFIKTDWVRENQSGQKDEKIDYVKIYNAKVDGLKSALVDAYPIVKDADTGNPSISTTSVEPTISKELTQNAFICVLLASLGIILYLTIRFAIGGLAAGLKFGVCAVIALIHDAAFILGMFAILGKVVGWEVDSVFVTAVLTIIGFSVHDTIVVYDRIRENLKHRQRGEAFDQVCNKSILQTLSRSINTSMTVVITLLALVLLGGPMLRHFYIAMLAGIIIGTYSSIFNATPLIIVWEKLANGSKGTKKIDEKPMVEKPMVKTASLPTDGEAAGDEASTTTDTQSGRVKRKPAGKKRRF